MTSDKESEMAPSPPLLKQLTAAAKAAADAAARDAVFKDVNLLALVLPRAKVVLGRIAQCCLAWRDMVSTEDHLWRPILVEEFPATAELLGVISYKDLYMRMTGVNLVQQPTTLDNYQFLVTIKYENAVCLSTTLHGKDFDFDVEGRTDTLPEGLLVPGEDYRVPCIDLKAPFDLSWLDDYAELSDDDDDPALPNSNDQQVRSRIERFSGLANEDFEIRNKLMLNITIFRSSDQRTATLLNCCVDPEYPGPMLVFESARAPKVYPGLHRRRTPEFPHLETDEMSVMATFDFCGTTDPQEPLWKLHLHLTCLAEADNDVWDGGSDAGDGFEPITVFRKLQGFPCTPSSWRSAPRLVQPLPRPF